MCGDNVHLKVFYQIFRRNTPTCVGTTVVPRTLVQTQQGTPPRAVEERVRLFPAYEDAIRAYYERWEEMVGGPIGGTVEILADLREKGYPLYALSNWSAETFYRVRERYEFLTWFEELVISGEVGLVKPDPAIFELLLQRVGRPVQDCLFIDDNLPNIETARSMGFQTVHFKSPEGLREVLGEMGVV